MEKLKVDSLLEYKFLSNLHYSPDGHNLAFKVSQADKDENEYNSNLWIYNISGDNFYQLTSGKKDGNFAWLNSDEIIFTSKRQDNDDEKLLPETEFYKININGGEAIHLKTIEKAVGDFKVENQGQMIFTAMKDLKEQDEEELKNNKDYQVLEEIPYWSNGKGFTDSYRNHLYSLDFETGEVKELVGSKNNVGSFVLQGDKIAFTMSYFEDKAEITNNLYLYELGSGNLHQLTDRDWSISMLEFKNANQLYFAANNFEGMGLNSNPDLYELNLDNREVNQLTAGLDKSLWTSVGNDCRLGGGQAFAVDDGRLYFISTEGYNAYLNRLNDGQVERIIDREGTVDLFDIFEGQFAFIGFRDNKLQELYIFEDGEERQVSSFNDQALAEKMISEPEHFTVETSDGLELDAWIIKPVGYQQGEKYPAVLEIHGGPKTVYGSIFFNEFQILANEGYAVIFSNPRGSDGQGDEFADIRGGYGDRDYQDLMEVTDAAIERYDLIDSDRLGVAGGSYGGYMTNWIVGQTDRFKAAVSQRSISNWVSMFATTDIGYFFVEDQAAGATPWNNFDELWDSSPLKYADRVSTPTLLIHSEEDYRCWLTEALQFFTALKYHGVESRLTIFKGENHELSRGGKPEHRIRRYQEMVDWFNKYLK
ncbi:MAG: prolyl oligopeptidase family serine peptidase [Bacillota bacterium]